MTLFNEDLTLLNAFEELGTNCTIHFVSAIEKIKIIQHY